MSKANGEKRRSETCLGGKMKQSTDRIIVSHAGALPALAQLPGLSLARRELVWQANTNLRALDSLVLECEASKS